MHLFGKRKPKIKVNKRKSQQKVKSPDNIILKERRLIIIFSKKS